MEGVCNCSSKCDEDIGVAERRSRALALDYEGGTRVTIIELAITHLPSIHRLVSLGIKGKKAATKSEDSTSEISIKIPTEEVRGQMRCLVGLDCNHRGPSAYMAYRRPMVQLEASGV